MIISNFYPRLGFSAHLGSVRTYIHWANSILFCSYHPLGDQAAGIYLLLRVEWVWLPKPQMFWLALVCFFKSRWAEMEQKINFKKHQADNFQLLTSLSKYISHQLKEVKAFLFLFLITRSIFPTYFFLSELLVGYPISRTVTRLFKVNWFWIQLSPSRSCSWTTKSSICELLVAAPANY